MRGLITKFTDKRSGTHPTGMEAVTYTPADVRYTQQDKWTWPWPGAVQQGRFTNCWFGNQLPGDTNVIPNVAAPMWYHPRVVMNNPNWAVQYNRGYNIQSQSAVGSAILQQQVMQAWQNRMNG